jgi:hypothetical protein
LSDGLITGLAAYFPTQTPRPGIPGDPVHGIVKDLTDEQLRFLAVYLQSL